MALTSSIIENHSDRKVQVFRKFFAKLMSLQKQLAPPYHTDSFLGDRLITAIGIPDIQTTLRDRMLRTSNQAFSRISNPFFARQRSAVCISACSAHVYTKYEKEAHFSLGKRTREIPKVRSKTVDKRREGKHPARR